MFTTSLENYTLISIETTVYWIIVGYVVFHFLNFVMMLAGGSLQKNANSLRIVLLSS